MKYQVGDTVLILHSGEEAVVTDIINDKMLMVDVQGIIFPVYMDQVDFPYYKRFTDKKAIPPSKEKKYIDDLRKEKQSADSKKEDGVWLTFLPVMDIDEFGDVVVEDMKLHLTNHTYRSYNFTYKLLYYGKPDFELKNLIHPFEDFYLHDIPFENLNDNPSFTFCFSLTEPDKKKADSFETSLKLKPKQLFARIEELKQKNLATFSQQLFQKYPDRVYEEKPVPGPAASKSIQLYEATKAKQYMEQPRSVIDLHIEKLTDDYSRMSNYEILQLQLKTFEKYYQLSIVHQQPSLIVIHGVGEGVLRDEIHAALRLKKEVKSFVNQYHPSFGFGATEILFQY